MKMKRRCAALMMSMGLGLTWFGLSYADSPQAIQKPFQHFQIKPNLEIITISPSVLIVKVSEQPFPAYSMIVKMPQNHLLMVDTPYTPTDTQILLNWLEKKFGQQNIVAINTHYHVDRLGGNQILIQNHIPVYGSDLTVRLLKKNGVAKLPDVDDPQMKAEFKKLKLTPPDHIFPIDKGLILNIGGQRVEVYYPGAAHTEDNVVVYIPSKKLLFGGCMIRDAHANFGYLGDANLKAWLSSVEHLQKFKVHWVIPGHPSNWQEDSTFSPDLIEHTKMLLNEKNTYFPENK